MGMVGVDLVGVAEGDKPCGLAAGLSPGLTCQGVLSGDGGELVLGVEQGPDQTGVAVAEPAFEEVGVEEACEGLEEVGKGVVAAGASAFDFAGCVAFEFFESRFHGVFSQVNHGQFFAA